MSYMSEAQQAAVSDVRRALNRDNFVIGNRFGTLKFISIVQVWTIVCGVVVLCRHPIGSSVAACRHCWYRKQLVDAAGGQVNRAKGWCPECEGYHEHDEFEFLDDE
jgi:hypothetical protein